MDQSERDKKIYRQRRKTKERVLGEPLYKRALKGLESVGRALTLDLFKLVLGIKPIVLPIDFSKINSILILRNDAIGDMVLSTPLWHAIRQRFPHIRIGVVGSFRNLTVIENDPSIDLRFDCSLDSVNHILDARREVRKHRWDLVMPLTYSKRTKMAVLSKLLAPKTPAVMILMFADSSDRYKKLFEGVVETPVDISKTSMTELLRFHLELTAGIEIPPEAWRQHLYPRTESLERIKHVVGDLLSTDGTTGYVHVNLEARNWDREFGLEASFKASSLIASDMPDHSIIWTASPVSAQAAVDFLAEHPNSKIHFVPTENIHDLFAVVRYSDLVITPDTSVVHIAAAERKAVVGFYIKRNEWPPHQVPAILLTPIAGAPLSTIPVEWVVESAIELLHRPAEAAPEVRWRQM